MLVALDNGMLYIPRRSIEGMIQASEEHSSHLPSVFLQLQQIMMGLRRSIFIEDTADERNIRTENLDQMPSEDMFERDMMFLSNELDAMIVGESDNNVYCQLVCLRATRNLCKLLRFITSRPFRSGGVEDNTAGNSELRNDLHISWRHCCDEILNDLILAQCMSKENRDGSSFTTGRSLLSNEAQMKRLLFNVQAVGWISDRISRLLECVLDGSLAVLSLCFDCFDLGAVSVDHSEGPASSDIALSESWKWYTLIPAEALGTTLSSKEDSKPSDKKPHDRKDYIKLDTIKECYIEYRDICFKYISLLFKQPGQVEERMTAEAFIADACSQLEKLNNFCAKWTQPKRSGSSPPPAPVHTDESKRYKREINYEAVTSAAISNNASKKYSPSIAETMKWESENFALSWAVNRSRQ